jgi:hypothetical protein
MMNAKNKSTNESNLNVLTSEDLQDEWNYRFQERLGIMAGPAEATGDQTVIAMLEADEAIEKLQKRA